MATLKRPKTAEFSGPVFHPDSEIAYTLPSHYYYDARVFEEEKRKIFHKSWLFVCFDSDVAEPGQYVTADLVDQPVFVVRDENNQLRGFYNACQHRGHTLLEGCGKTKGIVCPYHAWCYRLSGALFSVPNSKNIPDFDLEDYPLAEVRVEVFCRMVFVNLDPDAKPLSELVPGLRDEIYSIVPKLDSMHWARRDTLEIPANWKFVFDGLECYHCPYIHPGVMNKDDDYMTQDVRSVEHEWHSSHLFVGNRKVIDELRTQPGGEWAHNLDSYDLNLWYLWPNVMLMSHPGQANLKVAVAWPEGPSSTRRHIDHLLTTPEPSAIDVGQIERHLAVFAQDVEAMTKQQKGMKALGYRQGRLMIDPQHSWRSEHATHHFQSLVWKALNGADG